MEIFIGILILCVLFIGFSRLNRQQQETNNELDRMSRLLNSLRQEGISRPAAPEREAAAPEQVITPPEPLPDLSEIIDLTYHPQEPLLTPTTEPERMLEEERVTVPVAESTTFEPARPVYEEPQETWLTRFMHRNPDMEKFISENLVNKIGIAILVIGIGFFVKFAIDKDWINEIGRVFIGLLAGGALIGVAHRMAKSFRAFSSVLVAGGISVFYFTIGIAFHEYAIFSQTIAFALMVVITAFAVFLSIAYDKVELAVISVIGGFATPFILSTGEGNYIVLFTYLAILSTGMLVLSFYKKWNLPKLLCYGFTMCIFNGWLYTKGIWLSPVPHAWGLFFAALFYFIFFAMNVIDSLKKDGKIGAQEVSVLLSNTLLFFAAGLNLLNETQWQGLFTAALAIIHVVLAWLLFRNRRADRNLVYLLIGIVLTLVSLIAPIQLHGSYITLFWSAEAVLLLWFAQRSGIRLVKAASILVLLLMLVSLVMDWVSLYSPVYTTTDLPATLPLILNKAFITSLFAIIALVTIQVLLRKEEEEFFLYTMPLKAYRIITGIVLVLLIYLSPLLELSYQMSAYIDSVEARNTLTGIYNFSFVIILGIYLQRQQRESTEITAGVLYALAIFSYLLVYEHSFVSLRWNWLENGAPLGSFYAAHYLVSAMALYLLYRIHAMSRNAPQLSDRGRSIIQWLVCGIAVFVLSAELDQVVVCCSYTPGRLTDMIVKQNQKIGYPILWGICSFAFMFLGMKYKERNLRIISLSLFGLILLKLFLFDVRGMNEGGKIAAFISLGVLLLVVSFMYQKLKNLLLSNDENNSEEA